MDYDIGQCSIRPSATFVSPRCGSGLAATQPRLCCPDPALCWGEKNHCKSYMISCIKNDIIYDSIHDIIYDIRYD